MDIREYFHLILLIWMQTMAESYSNIPSSDRLDPAITDITPTPCSSPKDCPELYKNCLESTDLCPPCNSSSKWDSIQQRCINDMTIVLDGGQVTEVSASSDNVERFKIPGIIQAIVTIGILGTCLGGCILTTKKVKQCLAARKRNRRPARIGTFKTREMPHLYFQDMEEGVMLSYQAESRGLTTRQQKNMFPADAVPIHFITKMQSYAHRKDAHPTIIKAGAATTVKDGSLENHTTEATQDKKPPLVNGAETRQ